MLFQSTPSAWRETLSCFSEISGMSISIHSLRMEGDEIVAAVREIPEHISIHSLRMEGDLNSWAGELHRKHFNPLPPHGGRPVQKECTPPPICISIHSLRMEGDHCGSEKRQNASDFNPLPPHGGRRRGRQCLVCYLHISIHSLRMEGDRVPGL